MSHLCHHLYNQTMQWASELSMRQWFFVLIGAVLIGLFCMRGFGSRSSY
jgi:hypothetical protein